MLSVWSSSITRLSMTLERGRFENNPLCAHCWQLWMSP